MIGVGVALSLVYYFNGNFPKDLKLFNYDVPITARQLEILAWTFLVYLCVEYLIHVRSKFSDVTQQRRTHLMRLLEPYVWKRLDKDKKNQIEKTRKKDNPQTVFERVELGFGWLHEGTLRISVKPCFKNPSGAAPGGSQMRPFNFDLPYKDIRGYRLHAWIRLLFMEGVSFEYILPAIFPALAVALILYRRVVPILVAYFP